MNLDSFIGHGVSAPALDVTNLCVEFKNRPILRRVNFSLRTNTVLSVMGPSGTGKTTLLFTLNRLIEEMPGYTWSGEITIGAEQFPITRVTKESLRQKIGIVFQRPTIFPMSIVDNVVFGIRHLSIAPKRQWPAIAEKYLRDSFLWDEVKDRLNSPAIQLSIGQQQRLACARTLALEPEIVLLDEPTASLDPKATEKIEAMLLEIKKTKSLILVTHQENQATRLSDQIIMLRPYTGEETALLRQLTPKMDATQDATI